ncbi:biotin transporter BioY [Corynebacterium sp. 335C]
MQKNTIVDAVLIAAFAALIIVLGAVSIPIGGLGVPIVLQNMGMVLVGLLLGWKRGTLCVILFLAVGLVGVPNLAGFRTTLSALPGPTVGYLVGYIVTALVVGLLTMYRPRNTVAQIGLFIVAGIIGVMFQYLCGSVGLVIVNGMEFPAAVASNAAFILGDVVKVVIAAVIAAPVLRAIPSLRGNKAVKRAGVAESDAAVAGTAGTTGAAGASA